MKYDWKWGVDYGSIGKGLRRGRSGAHPTPVMANRFREKKSLEEKQTVEKKEREKKKVSSV